MRLDIFLKKALIIKRRSIAKQMCDKGNVLINGNTAKPSKELHIDDNIIINWHYRKLSIKIEILPAGNVSKAKSKELYTILSDERIQETVEIED